MDLNYLIEEGKKIRGGLTYINPPTNVIRLYHVYKLGNDSNYYSWASLCTRFLQSKYPDDNCVSEFKDVQKEFEEKTNHFCPDPLDKMIGILEGIYQFENLTNNIKHKKEENNMQNEIEIIERDYEIYKSFDYNSINSFEAIDKYNSWYSNALVLFSQYIGENDEYFLIFKSVDNSGNGYSLLNNFHKIMPSYKVLISKIKHGMIEKPSQDIIINKEKSKRPLLFISHSSDNEDIATNFVKLLRTLGFNKKNLFCSSVPGFGIEEGCDIYNTLKNKFKEYEIYVVFILSESYYKSPACLNEMGAAWILQSNYSTIITPGFKIPQIKGAINPNKIGIKIDDERHAKCALNQFKDKILDLFKLEYEDEDVVWEESRDEFIKESNTH